MNLTFVMCRKGNGKSIKGDPSIERLVEIRTVSIIFFTKVDTVVLIKIHLFWVFKTFQINFEKIKLPSVHYNMVFRM